MKKLLAFIDNSLLKWGVAFALLFIPLYPKLPSIQVTHTWVYIRLEDFLISLIVGFWLLQLLRKKVTLPFPVGKPIVLYWIVGLCSLIFSMIFIGPHLANYFPKIAALEYLRRIEYMILFFAAFSTVKNEKDIKEYLVIIAVALTAVVIYGFGQRWYIVLWQQFPAFFEKYSFCFPSFQTGNEEFAKGIPLCLPSDARITSTFGGHYDLAAFLVVLLPVLIGGIFAFKRIWAKIYMALLSISSIVLLILTASRISFVAYLVGICAMLIFAQKKKFLIPTIIVSIGLLLLFSGSTAKRFLETIRFTSVVTNTQGQVVGVTANSLPQALQKKISKNPIVVEAPPPTQNLPTGSSFITLPQIAPKTTNVAVVQSSASQATAKNLKLANGGIEISTISGSFLIQKALVYDISFTTRFQSEWPNAWRAFLRNPLLGSGYSSITLATDGDYHRLLGETGILGFLSFIIIFIYMGILVYVAGRKIPSVVGRMFVYGMSGGVIGLFCNAVFIDVFEASKVAEPLWILLGIVTGIVALSYKESIRYTYYLKKIFTSSICIGIYLFIALTIVFFGHLSNFFVADDFTWLHWAANSTLTDLLKNFLHAGSFFYRPLDKALMLFLFTFFSFVNPEGYHVVMLTLHFFVALGVYFLIRQLSQKKLLAFFGSMLFLVLPAHGETLYWISTVSITLSSVFLIYMVLAWFNFRKTGSAIAYIYMLLLAMCALFSYEMAVIFPLLLLVVDVYLGKIQKTKRFFIEYIPMVLILIEYGILRFISKAVGLGGDYSYNIPHLIPNIIGNSTGYIGVTIFGEHFLPFYTLLRDSTRSYAVLIAMVGLMILLGIIILAFLKRDKISSWLLHMQHSRVIFGLLFALVALLPFIALGNITERYLYLASVGFIVIFVVWTEHIFTMLQPRIGRVGYILLIAVYTSLIFWYAKDAQLENTQWQQAGNITKNTLTTLHSSFPNIGPNSQMYFVNVPIRKDNAWIFPVGLSDGLWFLYRDDTLKIYSVKTAQEAKEATKNVKTSVYIFSFDSRGKLSQIQ